MDCDDSSWLVYPGAEYPAWLGDDRGLKCRDFDLDCDGVFEGQEDFDGDGVSWCQKDCDDEDRSRYPGATDAIDGVDQDCDGTDGVGESPTLVQLGDRIPYALAHTMTTADVNGDGCDDLVFSESGFTSQSVNTSAGQAGASLHVWLGCTEPRVVRSLDLTGDPQGLGQFLTSWRRGDIDVVVASTRYVLQYSYGVVQFWDFSVDPPMLVEELYGENSGDIQSATVVHGAEDELLVSSLRVDGSGPGSAWSLPLNAPVFGAPDRQWWGTYDDLLLGWQLMTYDRDGDGLEEVVTSSVWHTPVAAQAGELVILGEPGLENADEVWLGDIGLGYFFGTQVYPAPDLPNPGDRGLLAGDETMYEGGALYVLPPLGPGEYTLNDASTLLLGEYEDEWFGVAAAVGDVNGDGEPDIVVGAPNSPNQTDNITGMPGKVYVFLGPITGPVLTRSDARVFVGTQPSEHFGYSVQLADLNGDGTPEIYVGAPSYTDETLPVATRPHIGALYRIDLD